MSRLFPDFPASKHRELSFEHYDSQDVRRRDAEKFIYQVFADAYQARITHFLPELFALRSDSNSILAAVGMRSAAQELLFLENYLDIPIENAISDITHSNSHPVARSNIIELGNLTSVHPGSARMIIIAMTTLLYHAGFKWVSFTAVPVLVNTFKKLGLNPLILAPASKERLMPGSQAEWGSYYDSHPMVYVGQVEEGYNALLRSNISPEIVLFASQWKKPFFPKTRDRFINDDGRSLSVVNSFKC